VWHTTLIFCLSKEIRMKKLLFMSLLVLGMQELGAAAAAPAVTAAAQAVQASSAAFLLAQETQSVVKTAEDISQLMRGTLGDEEEKFTLLAKIALAVRTVEKQCVPAQITAVADVIAASHRKKKAQWASAHKQGDQWVSEPTWH
jgi:hypothetical protein